MGSSAAADVWKVAFEITPIILTGGIAQGLGGYLPIAALTGVTDILGAVASGSISGLNLDTILPRYKVLPGATLIRNDLSRYPFANQTVAANAIIAQPNTISMMMMYPAQTTSGGYPVKLMTMMALRATLTQHNLSGGLYTLITPSGIYANCALLGMTDASGGESNQQQYEWQLDFEQPLVTLQAAQAAQNAIMQAITNQVPGGGGAAQNVLGLTALAIGSPAGLAAAALTPPTIQ